MKILFATDIQGSEICFRKLLNAGKFYGAQVVIMGGDMSGKMVVPIIKGSNGVYTSRFQQADVRMDTEEEMRKFTQRLRDMGFYPYLTDMEEMGRLQRDRAQADSIFRQLIIETIQGWVELADEKLKGTKTQFFWIPGNDDDYFIDPVLAESRYMVNVDGKVIRLEEGYEILSLGGSNPTPWHTPREFPEEEIQARLEKLAERVDRMEACLFNIHVPPFNSKIDEVAELDEDLRVVTEVGHTKKKPAGSKAVRSAIEKYQPLLGLFGHVHEGRGYIRIGKTLCINPGSNYTEGILNGCLVTLEKGKLRDFQLTTG